ncbi:adenylyltransferase/cytidyltransferase family protein [Candidatus Uhrbacteria bacterium]|nr:adenylyltransferase/cytidyltransferase family protein [Candidatus Uhrbacteria bacterium]
MAKRVLVFGTFDGLHSGHLFFLRLARSLGEELLVSVARDRHVQAFKQKQPQHPENDRLQAVRALSFVKEAELSDEVPGSFGLLEKWHPDRVVIGHDQDELETALKAWASEQLSPPIIQRLEDEYAYGTCQNCSCHH